MVQKRIALHTAALDLSSKSRMDYNTKDHFQTRLTKKYQSTHFCEGNLIKVVAEKQSEKDVAVFKTLIDKTVFSSSRDFEPDDVSSMLKSICDKDDEDAIGLFRLREDQKAESEELRSQMLLERRKADNLAAELTRVKAQLKEQEDALETCCTTAMREARNRIMYQTAFSQMCQKHNEEPEAPVFLEQHRPWETISHKSFQNSALVKEIKNEDDKDYYDYYFQNKVLTSKKKIVNYANRVTNRINKCVEVLDNLQGVEEPMQHEDYVKVVNQGKTELDMLRSPSMLQKLIDLFVINIHSLPIVENKKDTLRQFMEELKEMDSNETFAAHLGTLLQSERLVFDFLVFRVAERHLIQDGRISANWKDPWTELAEGATSPKRKRSRIPKKKRTTEQDEPEPGHGGDNDDDDDDDDDNEDGGEGQSSNTNKPTDAEGSQGGRERNSADRSTEGQKESGGQAQQEADATMQESDDNTSSPPGKRRQESEQSSPPSSEKRTKVAEPSEVGAQVPKATNQTQAIVGQLDSSFSIQTQPDHTSPTTTEEENQVGAKKPSTGRAAQDMEDDDSDGLDSIPLQNLAKSVPKKSSKQGKDNSRKAKKSTTSTAAKHSPPKTAKAVTQLSPGRRKAPQKPRRRKGTGISGTKKKTVSEDAT